MSNGAFSAVMTDNDGVRDEFGWDGSKGVSLSPMFKNLLSSAVLGNDVGWRIKQSDGNKFLTFNSSGSLVEVRYIYGQSITLARSNRSLKSATDSFGRSLKFNYDVSGLRSVSDPNGNYIYFTYYKITQPQLIPSSSVGVPATVTFQDGTFKTYLWDEVAFAVGDSLINQLTGILDENGKRYASFGYTNGNAISTESALKISQRIDLIDFSGV